jgi:hypothetical protein
MRAVLRPSRMLRFVERLGPRRVGEPARASVTSHATAARAGTGPARRASRRAAAGETRRRRSSVRLERLRSGRFLPPTRSAAVASDGAMAARRALRPRFVDFRSQEASAAINGRRVWHRRQPRRAGRGRHRVGGGASSRRQGSHPHERAALVDARPRHHPGSPAANVARSGRRRGKPTTSGRSARTARYRR